jgi:vancomycin resistance protein YoaR
VKKFAVTAALIFVSISTAIFLASAQTTGIDHFFENQVRAAEWKRLAAEEPIFTIVVGEKRYPVTNEILAGGWWRERERAERYAAESLQARAARCKNFKKEFPDIWRIVQNIVEETQQKPHDGQIVFNPGANDRFLVEGAHEGTVIDKGKLVREILSNLAKGGRPEIIAPTRIIRPASAEQVLSKIGLRGGFTTYFEQNPNREHNIALALSKFNGLVIENGESVSFNKVVGPRSADRGFMEAKIILDGEFVPGIGGGVCQASTTVFNAAMLAGMQIDRSSAHSLPISYVPLGRDAMVSSSSDLVFTNNSGGRIFIEAGVRGAAENHVGHAFVKIYGNKSKVKFKPRTIVADAEANEIEPQVQRATTFVDVYAGEKLVATRPIRKSKYQSRKI